MPRTGPRRPVVGLRLGEEERARTEARAAAAGINLSEQLRRDNSDADALARVAEVARNIDPAAEVWASMVSLHCGLCDEIHRLAVAYRPHPQIARNDETCWCPRRNALAQGTYKPGTDRPGGGGINGA